MVDTALKTADSGYLTRRLVDVAQDVIVRDVNCGSKRGIYMQAILEGDKVMVKLQERIYGRALAEDVVNEKTGEVIGKTGDLITRVLSEKIAAASDKHKQIKVRSPLTCESQFGVCQTCYGWSLTNNHPVDIGEAIGIIAAQSIGEPGTQLTMRTFHTGGAVAGGSSRAQSKSPAAGTLTFNIPSNSVRTAYGDVVEQTTKDGVLKISGTKEHSVHVPVGSLLLVASGTEVKAGTVLAEYDPPGAKKNLTERAAKDITADISGRIMFQGFQADEKRDSQGNISRTANRSGIIWVLEGDVYNLPSGAHVVVKDGQDVKPLDVLAEITIYTEYGGEVRFGPETRNRNS